MKPLLCLSAAVLLSGCVFFPYPIPHTQKRSPIVTGQVVDAKTGRPIEGATVQLTTDNNPKPPYGHSSHAPLGEPQTTSADGQFYFPTKRNFHLIYILHPRTPIGIPRQPTWDEGVRISKPGYRPAFEEWSNSVSWRWGNADQIDFGKISLTKTKAQNR